MKKIYFSKEEIENLRKELEEATEEDLKELFRAKMKTIELSHFIVLD